MVDEINQILDDLDTQMLFGFQDYKAQALEIWQSFQGNNGQLVLVHQYIIPVVQDHIAFAKEEWPINTGPEELVEEIINAYDDPEAIERAFSDTIYYMFGELEPIHTESLDFQNEHNFVLGGRVVAHSTNPPWTADL